jgi:photosystem II stability/assembly factor-like uncharacterized protein
MKTIYVLMYTLLIIGAIHAGMEWSLVNPKTTLKDLHDIAFVTDNIKVVVGKGGAILRTSDNGRTWNYINIKDNVNFNSVDFLNEKTGYIVGDSGRVYISNDSGKCWADAGLNVKESLCHVEFVNESCGYISGAKGLFLRTNNGGNDWHAIYLDSGILKFEFFNAAIGVGVMKYFIVHTADSGKTWRNVYYLGGDNRNEFHDISYADSLNVFATHYPVGLVYSSNGGNENHWTDIPKTNWFDAKSIDFSKSGNGIVNRGLAGWYSYSHDGGNTWVDTNGLPGGNLSRVKFENDSTAWLIGACGAISKSLDAGQTWNDLAYFTRSCLDISFVGSKKALLLSGNKKLFSSNDYFESFTEIDIPVQFSHICFPDSNTGYAYYPDSGATYLSVNQGVSWEKISTGIPDTFDINAFEFKDKYTGLAVGTGDIARGVVILKTTNGGVEWTKVKHGVQGMADHIGFFNDSTWIIQGHDWIYAEGDFMMVSKNAGATWEKIFTNIAIYNISVSDESTVYGHCNNGMVLKSLDYGRTWVGAGGIGDQRSGICFKRNVGIVIGRGSDTRNKAITTFNNGKSWNYEKEYESLLVPSGFSTIVMNDSGIALAMGIALGCIGTITKAKFDPYSVPTVQLPVGAESHNYNISVNFIRDRLNLSISLSNNEKICVKIIDLRGRIVKNVLTNNNLSIPEYTNTFDVSGLANGLYTVMIKTNTQVFSKKCFLQK